MLSMLRYIEVKLENIHEQKTLNSDIADLKKRSKLNGQVNSRLGRTEERINKLENRSKKLSRIKIKTWLKIQKDHKKHRGWSAKV